MRNKYNMNLNPRRLSSKDIEKHMDFEALLAEYRKSTQRKKPAGRFRLLYIGSAVAAALAGLLFYFNTLHPETERKPAISTAQYFARQELVRPPLESVGPAIFTHQVDAASGGTYEFAGGSKLVVPSRAFLDDRGRLIEGDVDLHYREMHDYVDFFVSGIPMVYDSAGTRLYLESAGMVEIFALKNGERVKLAPGKAIEVELVSEITLPNINVSPRYKVYLLDTLSRNWVYQDVDHLQFLEALPIDQEDPLYWPKTTLLETMNALEEKAAAAKARMLDALPAPAAPVKPQPLSSDQPSLELRFLDNVGLEGQDRKFYEGTIWQVSPKNPDFDPALLNETWEDFRFRPVNNLEWELTLLRGDGEQRLIVMPVLSGGDYERAMEVYEAAYADYEIRLAENKARLQQMQAALEREIESGKNAAQRLYEAQVDSLKLQGTRITGTGIRRKVVNRFIANHLGIWTCDRPQPFRGSEVNAGFVDQHGNEYRDHTAYVVRKGSDTVFRFYTGKGNPLLIDPDSECLIWLVSNDNKMAVLRPKEIREAIDPKKKENLLRLELIDKEVRSERDVREILGLWSDGSR